MNPNEQLLLRVSSVFFSSSYITSCVINSHTYRRFSELVEVNDVIVHRISKDLSATYVRLFLFP